MVGFPKLQWFLGVASLAVGLAGCSTLLGIEELTPDPSDAAPSVDAQIDARAVDAPLELVACSNGHTARFVSLGLLPPADSLTLDTPGEYIYDSSGESTLTGPNGAEALVRFTINQPYETDVLVVNNLLLGAQSVLRVIGDRPVVIAAHGDITIAGEVDASSSFGTAGAGSNPNACEPRQATVGTDDASGAGGGGGGGYGGLGGAGGNGSLASMNVAEGGTGGLAIPAPSGILAGCRGRRGGAGDDSGVHATGGHGGGAVYMAACESIAVTGTVHAGGAGGRSGNRDGGGGGGGSGGYVGLDAMVVEVGAGAILAANGGAGGAGASNDMNTAEPGQNAQISDQPAATVSVDGNFAGGVGGARQAPSGEPAPSSEQGGGGGGGGVGFIAIGGQTVTIDAQATVSPEHIPLSE